MEDLERFRVAHKRDYAQALVEIQNGYKESHWMWYIFPQIKGLGRSSTARYYAIRDISEAKEFLNDPYLGDNLREISKELLAKSTNNAEEIFGYVDSMKLRSSMTLFHYAGETCDENRVFYDVLNKYFNGELDEKTLALI
ncbi:MAG: DUF1810 domain-containing protein [Clostridia bacterium]|nr:DUF1810 domain-containing protein [Clostridia bacterium]